MAQKFRQYEVKLVAYEAFYDRGFEKEKKQAECETKKPNKETKRGSGAMKYSWTDREAKGALPPDTKNASVMSLDKNRFKHQNHSKNTR